MDFTSLGRTGLRVSRLGLGCGGHSRLGLSLGNSEADAIAVVREALDLGVNFIDTAEGYGTEEAVGKAIESTSRSEIVISTKAGVNWKDHKCTAAEMIQRIEACLGRLRTDYIDVFHLHGVSAEDYPYAVSGLLPAVISMQAAGKVRFVGITETFGQDPSHNMLKMAVQDRCWDVMMVGFNMLNQSSRESVLSFTQQQNVGTLCMFAVRRALSKPEALKELMEDLVAKGLVDANSFNPDEPLGFLMAEGGALSIPDAAYRFCRYEPGMDVILSGTSSIAHLRENAASLDRPPLPAAVVNRLRTLFERVDCVSGN